MSTQHECLEKNDYALLRYYEIYIYKDSDEEWYMDLDGYVVPVNYCPICGEELNEESNLND